MKLCIVGIGGAGGKVTQEFLGNEDLASGLLSRLVDSEYLSPAKIKGIWLEADKNDAKSINTFFGDLNEGAYPGFFIPHDKVEDGCAIHVRVKEKYGYDVKKQGFVRDAQYLKAIFEIFDTDQEIQQIASGNGGLAGASASNGSGVDEQNQTNGNSGFRQMPNPIFDSAWEAIKSYTTLGGGECDGILFIVSFGGGTGTGFINPIINHIRNEGKADYPVLALGVLTELGEFTDRAQGTKQERRNLAAISAIYDLLTRSSGANGVILIDNQILLEKFGNDYTSANRFIHRIMQPMVAPRDYPGEQAPAQSIAQNFSQGLSKPPLFVPLYWSAPRRSNPEEELVTRALKDGKLFGCSPDKADYAVVFCRGFIDSEKIRQALSAQTGLPAGSIWVLRKMGGRDDEILILLRNPYGGDPEAYRKEGTLENRLCKVIKQALDYIRQNPENLFYRGKESKDAAEKGEDIAVKLTPDSEKALSRFFFGKEGCTRDSPENKEGFVFQLREARRKLQAGEKHFFYYPLRIFEKEKPKPKPDPIHIIDIRLDEKRIREIVDQRIEKRLAETKR